MKWRGKVDLVWKDNPRGQFYRRLGFAEREAILHVFSHQRKPAQSDLVLTNKLLEEMDKRELLLLCDCADQVPGEPGPYNCEVLKTSLRHLSTSRPHSEDCPLHRLRKDRDDDLSRPEGKISPLNPIGSKDWLPDRNDKEGSAIRAIPVNDTRSRRKQLKPVPALGRKLLTLLQAAGLNQLELTANERPTGLVKAVDDIKLILETSTMMNGVPLSELISCTPWLSVEKIELMLSHLENNPKIDARKKELCVYIVGVATAVTREVVTFSVRGKPITHQPAARVNINGETTYNAGSRAPYWVILQYRRGRDGVVYCHEGYAHAAYSLDNPVPIDSNKERETLKAIINACQYAGSTTNRPEAISLTKPLFSMKSIKDDTEEIIHPDFILNVVPKGKSNVSTLIIETMGYDSEEYVQRKTATHSWMAQEGTLLTDPPGWPEPPKTTFNRYLLSHIFKAAR